MSLVLITGSCGLVGSESALFFSKKGFDIIGVDNNARKFFFGKDGDISWIKLKLKKNIKNYRHYDTDIKNYSSLRNIFKKYKKNISLIIHCAAQPSHDWAYKEPLKDFFVNSLATLKLLENTKNFCKDSNFIFLSTNKVYGDSPNRLKIIEKSLRYDLKINDKLYKGIKEYFPIDNSTHSLFGCSKAYADLITQEYGKNLGIKTTIFRAGCITGVNHKGAKLHGFLSYLVKSCISNKSYDCIGYKGKQVRDNIHSFDLVNCFWEYFKKPSDGEVYNTGGGRISNCSILEAIKIIEEITNLKIKKTILKTNRIGDHIWYISNMKKFKNDYPNWKQKYSTKKILLDLINHFSN